VSAFGNLPCDTKRPFLLRTTPAAGRGWKKKIVGAYCVILATKDEETV
jgi:hypothetical protein